jgi:hypothetical protein
MEIPIQHDVYIWASCSFSSYLSFIPIHCILKCVNLIEIRFNAYLYAPSFLVLSHIIFENTAGIPRVEFGGKCRYLKANTDIRGQIRIFALRQITNTDFKLLMDMQKRTYCNKIFDKKDTYIRKRDWSSTDKPFYYLCQITQVKWFCLNWQYVFREFTQ